MLLHGFTAKIFEAVDLNSKLEVQGGTPPGPCLKKSCINLEFHFNMQIGGNEGQCVVHLQTDLNST